MVRRASVVTPDWKLSTRRGADEGSDCGSEDPPMGGNQVCYVVVPRAASGIAREAIGAGRMFHR